MKTDDLSVLLVDLQSYFMTRSIIGNTKAITVITWFMLKKFTKNSMLTEWGTLQVVHPDDIFRNNEKLDPIYQRLVVKEHEWIYIQHSPSGGGLSNIIGDSSWYMIDMQLDLINEQLELPQEGRKIWTIPTRVLFDPGKIKEHGIHYMHQGAINVDKRYMHAVKEISEFVLDFRNWLMEKRPDTYKTLDRNTIV